MAQWAVLGVSVFDFCGVTSKVIYQKSTPMSIEKSKFTLCSQYNLASVSQNSLCEVLFFVYSTANFEVAQASVRGKRKAGIAPGLCMNIQFSTRFWSNRFKMLAAYALVAVPARSVVSLAWQGIRFCFSILYCLLTFCIVTRLISARFLIFSFVL